MEHELQVHTEDVDHLWAELDYVVEFFGGLGYERCDVFFGWAWSTERDKSDLLMKGVNIPLLDLGAEIHRAQDAGLGRFTRDEVWISFEDRALEVQFCHHSGIHLSYPEPDDVTDHFFTRWQSQGRSLSKTRRPTIQWFGVAFVENTPELPLQADRRVEVVSRVQRLGCRGC